MVLRVNYILRNGEGTHFHSSHDEHCAKSHVTLPLSLLRAEQEGSRTRHQTHLRNLMKWFAKFPYEAPKYQSNISQMRMYASGIENFSRLIMSMESFHHYKKSMLQTTKMWIDLSDGLCLPEQKGSPLLNSDRSWRETLPAIVIKEDCASSLLKLG